MRVLAVAVVVVACAYDDPALDGPFKCDDAHPCPEGQQCLSNVCSGGGGTSADGVKCGSVTCGADMQCCAGPVASPVCQPANASCSAGATAECDGVEDCATGDVCCGTSNTACGAPGCGNRACQSSDDCSGVGTGSCCFDITYLPWGFCC